MTFLIELERVNPLAERAPPDPIIADLEPHRLSMPDGSTITVYAIGPTAAHPPAQRDDIVAHFPFFHRRIIGASDALVGPTGGDLLSPRAGSERDDRFASYFSAAEVTVRPAASAAAKCAS